MGQGHGERGLYAWRALDANRSGVPFDDPSEFGMPQMAIFTCDKQAYHRLPEGVPAFDKMPG